MLTYRTAGVNPAAAKAAFSLVEPLLKQTWIPGNPIFGFRYFANVVDIGIPNLGIAISTDGVGSKLMIAAMLGKFDTIGIDCIAMNVNDILCVGATPISIVDYVSVEHFDVDVYQKIMSGLIAAATLADVAIVGGETSQGHGNDLVATAIGTVPLNKIIIGQNVQPGDVVIGIESSGIHSNGLTLARKVFNGKMPRKIAEELLTPTRIYVDDIDELYAAGINIKALAHITGDGLLNLGRVAAPVGFVIDYLPPQPEIFARIEQVGQISRAEMFSVFNMGIGFCVVVDRNDVDRVCAALGKSAHIIGYAIADPERRIQLPHERLHTENGRFVED